MTKVRTGIIVIYYDRETLKNEGYFIRPFLSEYFVDYANRYSSYRKKRFIRVDGNMRMTKLLRDIIWASKYDDINLLTKVIRNIE